MDKVVFLLRARPGKMDKYIEYVLKNRLSDHTLKQAGVRAWSIFVQDDHVVVYLEAQDTARTMRLLAENPQAQRFEKGEAEFLILPKTLSLMKEILHYEEG